jgi:hypothetical protein
MKNFGLEMYNLEKHDFPIKQKNIQFDTLIEAENYCTELNKKLKRNYWKVSRIG